MISYLFFRIEASQAKREKKNSKVIGLYSFEYIYITVIYLGNSCISFKIHEFLNIFSLKNSY